MKEGDIISDVLNRAIAVVRTCSMARCADPSLLDEICSQIANLEEAVRIYWGGATFYIAKKPNNDEARRQALNEVNRTGQVAAAAAHNGIARATLYRLLRKRDLS